MGTSFPSLHVVTDARPGRIPLAVVRAVVGTAVSRELTAMLAVQVRVEDDVLTSVAVPA